MFREAAAGKGGKHDEKVELFLGHPHLLVYYCRRHMAAVSAPDHGHARRIRLCRGEGGGD